MKWKRIYTIFVIANLVLTAFVAFIWIGAFQDRACLIRKHTTQEQSSSLSRFITEYRSFWFNQVGLVCAEARLVDSKPSGLMMFVTDAHRVDSISVTYIFRSYPGYQIDRRLTGAPIIVIPYWMLLVIFGMLPLSHVGTATTWYTARKRTRDGLCRVCGYDLRATPNRCPECGNTAGGKTSAKA